MYRYIYLILLTDRISWTPRSVRPEQASARPPSKQAALQEGQASKMTAFQRALHYWSLPEACRVRRSCAPSWSIPSGSSSSPTSFMSCTAAGVCSPTGSHRSSSGEGETLLFQWGPEDLLTPHSLDCDDVPVQANQSSYCEDKFTGTGPVAGAFQLRFQRDRADPQGRKIGSPHAPPALQLVRVRGLLELISRELDSIGDHRVEDPNHDRGPVRVLIRPLAGSPITRHWGVTIGRYTRGSMLTRQQLGP